MGAESVGLIAECAECGARWLPADDERWRTYLTGRRAAGARLLLPGLRSARIRRRLSRAPVSAFGDHIRAG